MHISTEDLISTVIPGRSFILLPWTGLLCSHPFHLCEGRHKTASGSDSNWKGTDDGRVILIVQVVLHPFASRIRGIHSSPSIDVEFHPRQDLFTVNSKVLCLIK
jgi:hypothetical protein